MKNEKIWALVIIIAIIFGSGLAAFIIWQNNQNKAGYVNQDSLFKLIGQGFEWFNENYASDTVKNGRNSDVAEAVFGSGSGSSSGASIGDVVSMFS